MRLFRKGEMIAAALTLQLKLPSINLQTSPSPGFVEYKGWGRGSRGFVFHLISKRTISSNF